MSISQTGLAHTHLVRLLCRPKGGAITIIMQSFLKFYRLTRPFQGFGVTGKRGIYFRETGEQMPCFEMYTERNTIMGNREHKKPNF